MRTRNRTTKLLTTALGLGVLAAVCAVWGARPAQAIIIVNSKTGLFGVTGGQTVRVSILNAQAKGDITPCVGLFDLSGNRLARQEAGMPLTLGQGAFFDFDAASLGLRAGQRAQIRVEVELPPPDDGRAGRIKEDDAIVTVEVFDNASQSTMFVVPATTRGFNPQPEPPMPQH